MAAKLEAKTAVAFPGYDQLFFSPMQLGEFRAKFESSLILVLANAISFDKRLRHCSSNFNDMHTSILFLTVKGRLFLIFLIEDKGKRYSLTMSTENLSSVNIDET